VIVDDQRISADVVEEVAQGGRTDVLPAALQHLDERDRHVVRGGLHLDREHAAEPDPGRVAADQPVGHGPAGIDVDVQHVVVTSSIRDPSVISAS
jgi:hypothetical protein